MLRWEATKYLIDAKMDIDSMMFIKSNRKELTNIDLNRRVDNIQMDFYVKLCDVLDNTICKNNKKKICTENKIIDDIYYERDKDKAHKDEDYVKANEDTFNKIIKKMKKEINETKEIAKDFLPKNITLDYVPHDKELFRLVYGVRKDIEDKINKDKYIQEKYEKFNTIQKKVFNDIETIKSIPENKRNEYAVIVENGINMYEGIQNRQICCIKLNILCNQDCWCKINQKEIKKWNQLKEEGFIDIFDRPCNISVWSNEKWNSFFSIMNGE